MTERILPQGPDLDMGNLFTYGNTREGIGDVVIDRSLNAVKKGAEVGLETAAAALILVGAGVICAGLTAERALSPHVTKIANAAATYGEAGVALAVHGGLNAKDAAQPVLQEVKSRVSNFRDVITDKALDAQMSVLSRVFGRDI